MDLTLNHSTTSQTVRVPSPYRTDYKPTHGKSVDVQRKSVGSSDSESGNKYHASLQKKEALNQVQGLENRIQRLVKEEQMAQKKIQEAQIKAETLERNRRRRIEEIKNKAERKESIEKEITERKLKFSEIRKAHNNRVEQAMNSVLRERLSSVKERRDQKVQHNAIIVKMENSFQNEKLRKKEFIQTSRNQGRQFRNLSQVSYRQTTREDYDTRVERERKAQEQALIRVSSIQMRKLEKIEAALLERLSLTHNEKQEVFKALEEKAEISKYPIFK